MLALTTSPGYHKTQTLNGNFYKNVSCGVIVDIKKKKQKTKTGFRGSLQMCKMGKCYQRKSRNWRVCVCISDCKLC